VVIVADCDVLRPLRPRGAVPDPFAGPALHGLEGVDLEASPFVLAEESWMVFGVSPGASMRVGPAINSGNGYSSGVQGRVRTQLTRGSPDATRSHDSPWSKDA